MKTICWKCKRPMDGRSGVFPADGSAPRCGRCDAGEFRLQNDPPRPKPVRFDNNSGKQRVLFATGGLAGQRALFDFDGSTPDDLVQHESEVKDGVRRSSKDDG